MLRDSRRRAAILNVCITQAQRLLALLVLALLISPGCRRNRPEVDVAINPQYPCRGEAVSFTYSLRNIDRIEVKDRQNNQLLSTSNSTGSFQIQDIRGELLPISATGWRGSKSRTKHIPGDMPLTIIEGTVNTEAFPFDNKLLADEQLTETGTKDCGCIYSGTQPVVCETAAPVYDVYDTYNGQSTSIDTSVFSPRARVVALRNESSFNLTLEHNGSSLGRIPPNGSLSVEFASDIQPAGEWRAIYDATNLDVQYRGTYVDGGKVCSGWLIQGVGDIRRNIAVRMSVRCNQ